MTDDRLGSAEHIELTERWAAHNYRPLPVVISSGEGAWVTDVEGRRYLDCLAGYSALNFGHAHPRLVAVVQEQLCRLTLTSRAFYNDQLGPFVRDLAALTGKEMVLPMNTGAEAVETAIKLSRRWGHQVRGVPADRASIVVMEGNFHGRTTTIVSFSTDAEARSDYGPFTPGFRVVPYGDVSAISEAVDDTTVAVLLEPVQGEAGVILPPDGFLRQVRALCDERNVLMVADEIQSGLARTGRTFACDHEGVVPDVYILGKALGGGLYPVSAVAADRDVMQVFTPGVARLDLRRQPARRRHRPRGGRHAPDGGVPGARCPARVGDGAGPPGAHRSWCARGALPWSVGRRRCRSGVDVGPAAVRGVVEAGCPHQGDARGHDPAGATARGDRG